MVSFDLEGDILPYIFARCVSYSASGEVRYDFAKVERRVLARCFEGRALLRLELQMMNFQSEERVSGALS